MKKFYLIVITALTCLFKAQTVVFSQPVYQQPSGSLGANYACITNNGNIHSTASRFTLNQDVDVTKINIFGIQGAQNLPNYSIGLTLYVYSEDSNGQPTGNPLLQTGTPVLAADLSSSSAGYSLGNYFLTGLGDIGYRYTVDFSALPGSHTLQANTPYWLYFVAKINVPSLNFTDQRLFGWATAPTGTYPYKCISNLPIASMCQNWLSVGTNGSAFSIEGLTELGTEETIHDSTIVIFPNPVTDIVSIKSVEKIKSLSILDASGRVVALPEDKSEFDFSGMPVGNYILRIQTENKTSSHKILKK